DESPILALPTVEVIGTSPLPGIGIDPDKLPNATYSFSAGKLLREGPRELPRAIRDRLGSVTTNDAQNNPFQPDLQYRGFVACPSKASTGSRPGTSPPISRRAGSTTRAGAISRRPGCAGSTPISAPGSPRTAGAKSTCPSPEPITA